MAIEGFHQHSRAQGKGRTLVLSFNMFLGEQTTNPLQLLNQWQLSHSCGRMTSMVSSSRLRFLAGAWAFLAILNTGPFEPSSCHTARVEHSNSLVFIGWPCSRNLNMCCCKMLPSQAFRLPSQNYIYKHLLLQMFQASSYSFYFNFTLTSHVHFTLAEKTWCRLSLRTRLCPYQWRDVGPKQSISKSSNFKF